MHDSFVYVRGDERVRILGKEGYSDYTEMQTVSTGWNGRYFKAFVLKRWWYQAGRIHEHSDTQDYEKYEPKPLMMKSINLMAFRRIPGPRFSQRSSQ